MLDKGKMGKFIKGGGNIMKKMLPLLLWEMKAQKNTKNEKEILLFLF